MSFEIDGVTWTPQTTLEHAQQMLTSINAIRQSLGQSLLLPTTANAVWLVLLAAGERNAVVDQKMNTGLNSLNPSLCDDQQILNLLPMVGTSRIPATFSTTTITVTVTSTSVALNIPAGTLLPFGNVNFSTNETYNNATPPATVDIAVTCDTLGAVVCPANSLTSFASTQSNVASVTNASDAAIGVNEESINQVRNRIIVGDTIPYGVNAAIRSLRSLTGITNANLFFNYSNTVNLTLPGGIDVSPRTSYIVLTGSSDQIANAYSFAMSAPTQGDHTQNYVTLAGQEVPILYNVATSKTIYVNVYYDENAPFEPGFDTVVKQLIVDSQLDLLPGVEVTAQFFSQGPLNNFQLATITGVTVSVDDITFGRFAVIDANKYPSIIAANVDVIGE